ncbi:MAG: copper resistance protein B [Acetobacteraceae bacterium]
MTVRLLFLPLLTAAIPALAQPHMDGGSAVVPSSHAQTDSHTPDPGHMQGSAPGPAIGHATEHAMGGGLQAHAVFEQFEARVGAAPNAFRWHGQAWFGTDTDRLWLKSEGAVLGSGQVDDGRQELLYSRAVSTYFDLQAGVRSDLDSGTGRTWAALGVRGLLPHFVELETTAYASNGGHYALRLSASYDILLTQRLVLQPQADINLYSKADPGRHIGAGLSSVDAGLRLRYDVTRGFSPYVGVAFSGRMGETARLAAQEGDPATAIRFVFGIRGGF